MDNRGDDTDLTARLARTEKALRQSGRELKWWQIELEHTTESLQRARRQRARLRQQLDDLADVLASALSEKYWAAQETLSGRGRLLGRGTAQDPEAELVREIEQCDHFDGAWYLRTYPKAARSGLSPAQHYLRHGNSRRLDPGPGFDTTGYLDRHPDAGSSDVPALLHAARSGRLDEATADSTSPADGLHL